MLSSKALRCRGGHTVARRLARTAAVPAARRRAGCVRCVAVARPASLSTSVEAVAVVDRAVDDKQPAKAAASIASHPVRDVPEAVDEQVGTSAAAATTVAADVGAKAPEDVFGTQELVEELQDRSQFGKRGEAWLFAQVAATLLVLIPPFSLKGLMDLVATLLITSGAVFILYGLFCLGRYFSPLPQPRRRHKLVTTGMYGYVRHPMYAGLVMAAFGLAALTGSECRLALSALLWWILEQKVAFEERVLSELYPEYLDYRRRVKKFFPYVY